MCVGAQRAGLWTRGPGPTCQVPRGSGALGTGRAEVCGPRAPKLLGPSKTDRADKCAGG